MTDRVPSGIDGRESNLIPNRPGHQPLPGQVDGNYVIWDDYRQTYTLQWGYGAFGTVHGWQVADWADTVIMSMEAIRADRHKLADQGFLYAALRDGRRLRQAIEAIEDELIKAAREDNAEGEPRMSWREMGDALHLHHTTVRERHGRLMAGETAEWHNWLTQNSPADMGMTAGEWLDDSDPGRGRYVAFAYDREDKARPTGGGGNQIMRRSDNIGELRHWAAARFSDTDRYVSRVRIFDVPAGGVVTREDAIETIERP